MRRDLYIDTVPDRSNSIVKIDTVQDIRNLFNDYCQSDREITLDCRSLRKNEFNSLLKFIEEYSGDIVMIVIEPVQDTLISRFVNIHKSFSLGKKRDIREFRLETVGGKLRQRVLGILGIGE